MFEKLKGKTVVMGFHGIGMVGFIAVDYMLKKLRAKKVGWLYEDSMPALVFAGKEGLEMPVEIYQRGSLAFIKTNVIMEQDALHEFLSGLFQKLKRNKPKQLVILGGLATDRKGVYGIANTKGRKVAEKFGLEEFEKEINVFGPMALSLIYGEKMGIPAVCILPSARPGMPDAEAASRAIKKLAEVFRLKVDVSDLEEEAAKIEKRMKELEKKDDLADRMFV